MSELKALLLNCAVQLNAIFLEHRMENTPLANSQTRYRPVLRRTEMYPPILLEYQLLPSLEKLQITNTKESIIINEIQPLKTHRNTSTQITFFK